MPLTREPLKLLLVFITIAVITFLTWGPALDGFFIGDDVWHMPLVYRAFHGEPWLIWKQFLAPYTFHDSLYLMYRPLTDISYAIDYFFWKDNAFGYHLTNLILHIVCGCLVFILTRLLLVDLFRRQEEQSKPDRSVYLTIPFMVSMLFAVYPGHAEPVCWVLPRIDPISAIFTFCSMIAALLYFRRNDKRWLAASTLSMILGFTIKEMTASIPLAIVAMYVILSDSKPEKSVANALQVVWHRIVEAALRIWPMLIALGIYLCVRAYSLGSLLGGYQGTIGLSLNESWLDRFLSAEGYWRLFHPINENVLGVDSIFDLLIRGFYLVLAVLVFVNQSTGCAETRVKNAVKLFALSLVMLLPAIQIWGVTSGLIGTRLAYTLCPSFFLAVLVLIYPIDCRGAKLAKALRIIATIVVLLMVAVNAALSHIYAKAWAEATNDVKIVRDSIISQANRLRADEKLAVVGLPAGIKGFIAFYSLDFVPGLLVPPLSKIDMTSRYIAIDGTPTNDTVINYSLFKQIQASSHKFSLFRWRQSEKKLEPFVIADTISLSEPVRLEARSLGSFLRHITVENGSTYFGNKSAGSDIDSVILSSANAIDTCKANLLELRIKGTKGVSDPWNDLSKRLLHFLHNESDFERIETDSGFKTLKRGETAFLSWDGQAKSRGDDAMPISFELFEDEDTQTYRINLTQYKSWLFSAGARAFRLDLPRLGYTYKIESAVLKNDSEFIPRINFIGSGNLNFSGLIDTESNQFKFAFDTSGIPKAHSTLIEVSKPYFEFHYLKHDYRDLKPSKQVCFSQTLKGGRGEFSVPPDVVHKKPAYYQVRVCALDADGNTVGSFSDPVTVSTYKWP